jgi:hypothetical protein
MFLSRHTQCTLQAKDGYQSGKIYSINTESAKLLARLSNTAIHVPGSICRAAVFARDSYAFFEFGAEFWH